MWPNGWGSILPGNECGSTSPTRWIERGVSISATSSDERWAEILKLKEGYYFEKATGSDVLFPDVSEVLSSLSSSFALALLTNTPADYFYKVFPSRLSALFAATVFADEVKENKPSPEPLHLLLKRLGMGKDDVCYVGDSLLDVEMAKATGVSIFAVARGANTRRNSMKREPTTLSGI